MGDSSDWKEGLAEARHRSNLLSSSLPDSIDAAALGVTSKAPFQLLAAREALIWRTEELARNACDALEKQDFATAGLLVRAIAESAALTWYLMEILQTRQRRTAQDLSILLVRILMGSKKWSDGPQAINILTCVDCVDKAVPGFRAAYDSLSEYAHPNWLGVSGLYSKIDRKKFITRFGRGFAAERAGNQLTNALVGGLQTFEHAYNKIAEDMPRFLAELESLWPEKNASD
jgi:hypothetical protein